MTSRRPVRPHPTLAPSHLGEAGSVATVVVVVGGVALVVLGASMLVLGLTMASRYADTTPPPNIDTLGMGSVIAGVGVLALGIGLLLSGLALIADVRGMRVIAGVLAVLTAGLAAAGTILAMITPPPDVIIAISLAVATLAFGVSGIILIRPRRTD